MKLTTKGFFYGLSSAPADGTNQVETLTIAGSPTGGTFRLRLYGDITAPIAHNANAVAVRSALQALPSIGDSGVTVTGGALPSGTLTITFQGQLGRQKLPGLEIASNDLTGGTDPTPVLAVATQGVDSYPFRPPAGAVASFPDGATYVNVGTPEQPQWSLVVRRSDVSGGLGEAFRRVTVDGAAASTNITVDGISTSDYLIAVLQFDVTGGNVVNVIDITSSATIYAENTIRSTVNTSGDRLLVIWAKQLIG